jgi:dipeptidyl aminopeptidase/acylaminoacyl peptidase
MVVMPHGGPHGYYDSWLFDVDAQFLASRGYAVLQVNFRGSEGRGVSFKEAGFREWGGKIQDDLIDGVKWAIEQGEVDGKRVCAYGASFGGYAALMLAAREPSMFRCAVGYAGVYDLNLLLTADDAITEKRTLNIIKRYVGDDKAELDRFSPAKLASRITAPVLLVHGGKDKQAPVEHAEAMRAALTAAGRPPEWLLAPNESHGFYDTKNRTEFYQRLEAFLAKNLAP